MAGSSTYMHFQHYQHQQHPQQRHSSTNNPAAAAQINSSSSFYTPGYAYYDVPSSTTYRNVSSVASGSTAYQPSSTAYYQQSQTSPANAPPAAPSFRAPAHKNSHHLHSIPPREKSTRTLIVDHMLWVHGEPSSFSLIFSLANCNARISNHRDVIALPFIDACREDPASPGTRRTRHDRPHRRPFIVQLRQPSTP